LIEKDAGNRITLTGKGRALLRDYSRQPLDDLMERAYIMGSIDPSFHLLIRCVFMNCVPEKSFQFRAESVFNELKVSLFSFKVC
jgi:hypothetical protein